MMLLVGKMEVSTVKNEVVGHTQTVSHKVVVVMKTMLVTS